MKKKVCVFYLEKLCAMTIEVDAWENGLTKHDEVKELLKKEA